MGRPTLRERPVSTPRVSQRILVVALLTIPSMAPADCRNAELTKLARSISRAFACEDARLTTGGVSCIPSRVPDCAGTLVQDLLDLGGTAGLTLTSDARRTYAPALRCQRAIVRGIAAFTLVPWMPSVMSWTNSPAI